MCSQETFCLEISGDFACFTRPEMKVERVSYDVITPSAARAVFEAILWKPAIRWQIEKIEVLNEIQWTNIRRNEVSSVANKGKDAIYIENDRVQRASLLLRDVAYRLHAKFYLKDDSQHIHLHPHLMVDNGSTENSYPKFAEMFKRRAKKGQCFHQPYLGTREFAANFKLVDSNASNNKQSINKDKDLGWMLYDINYSNKEFKPMFFNAKMTNGVIDVPQYGSEEIRQ